MANITSLMSNITSDIVIEAYIDDDTPWGQILSMLEIIREHPDVTSVRYISREENIELWRERGNLNPELFENIDPSMVRQYYLITIITIEAVSGVVEWMESPEMFLMGIANINHAADAVATLNSVNRTISVASVSIIAVLAILSVVIITNTIRLTIDGRKNEISIMKFIGSTNSFIRGPFLLEGMILGLAGSAIPLLLVSTFYDRLINSINNNLLSGVLNNDLFLSGASLLPVMIPSALFLGGFMGFFSSIVTIRKYLDV